MKKILIPLCCAALSASALELAAWRGETVTAWVPTGEKIECGSSGKGSLSISKKVSETKGIHVKMGVARDVKFVTKVGAFDYASVPDRVEWGRGALGSDLKRVVSVAVDADAQPGTYAFGDLKVRVVDRVLPPAKEWKYYLDLWQGSTTSTSGSIRGPSRARRAWSRSPRRTTRRWSRSGRCSPPPDRRRSPSRSWTCRGTTSATTATVR